MAETEHIIEVTDRNFEQEVLLRSMQTPVLVDFWAAWCAPCKALMPLLAKLAGDFGGAFVLAKVNTDENQQIAMQCGIRSLPTVVLIKEGQIVDGFVGVQPENAIRALLEKHQVTPRVAQPEAPPPMPEVPPEDRARAIAELRAMLASKPGDASIILQLTELLVAEGDYAAAEAALKDLSEDRLKEADADRLLAAIRLGSLVSGAPDTATLLGRLEGDPKNSEAEYLLGIRSALEGAHEVGLEYLLSVVRRDRKFGDDAARKAMVEVFALLGGAGPLVKQFRSRLYSALN
jgi:putative thioredoxin